jgi:hypothetical protein
VCFCTVFLLSCFNQPCITIDVCSRFTRNWSRCNSEWLLFNVNSAILQLYQCENKLILNEMMMRFALY